MMKSEAMHAAELSDADLVAESLNGNRDAFGHIVERYQTLIASLAYCGTGNVSRSEDLTQETFVTAWKQLAGLREPAKLRPWLCSVARFLICRELRRQDREPIHEAQSLDAMEEWTSPEPLPLDHAISQEELSLLWRSLERIPPTYRELLVLFYREHQSIEAVARGLGLSEDAVKQRLSRGRKFLQEQFLAFVAGALDQTRPGKTFALGVLAALPLLDAMAKGSAIGTALAKHGGVAAKSTGLGGFLQAISHVLMGMVYWLAALLPLGGYIGYKMGGDSQNNDRARRSVATFWRVVGISMLVLICLPLLAIGLLNKVFHLSQIKCFAALGFWMNVCLPALILVVVPLSLLIWIWRRRRRTVPLQSVSSPSSGQSPRSFTIWVVLAMTVALVNLGCICYSRTIAPKYLASPHSLSTIEVEDLIANSKGRDIEFSLYQAVGATPYLWGELNENGTRSVIIAPVEKSTLTLLVEKGIGYQTKIEGRDFPLVSLSKLVLWSHRVFDPFCCFIVIAGAVTLLRGRHHRQPGPPAFASPTGECHVDRGFAALAACGMVALAVAVGLTTNWKVRRIAADQVASVAAQHPNARYEVFEYGIGLSELWISEQHTADFIAPADESTLDLLKRQGITCQTYLALDGPGFRLFPERNQSTAVCWILLLMAVASGLLWWVVKGRSFCQVPHVHREPCLS
jgi:RNA polymerase sigma factor (sigma-70 family)